MYRYSNTVRIILAIVFPVFITGLSCTYGDVKFSGQAASETINLLSDRCKCKCQHQEWLPVFMAFSGNRKSVYDAWRNKSVDDDIPAKYGHTSRLNHLRSGFIDNWTKVKKVRVELFKTNVRVMWITFNGKDTDNVNWFSKQNIQKSSFNDLTPSSVYNYFSIKGDKRGNSLDRIFLINKSYAGCARDFGWFVIADKYLACGWERKGTKPVFLYTKNRTSRNWKTNSGTADTMVISILLDE